MMWLFLLSDTFIFGCFLTSYMSVRMSTTVPWPNPSEVFALNICGSHIPLILIAIMTFVLITSSGTMAMAVNFAYRRDRGKTTALMLVTAGLGRHLRQHAGVRVDQADLGRRAAVDQPDGRGPVRLDVLHDHGLPRSARLGRRDLSLDRSAEGSRGDYDRKGIQIVEIAGLYWHFVDLVWVFIFAFFYLW